MRGTLKSARKRGTFQRQVADVVPTFASGYTPRETYLTPEQFATLAEHLVIPRPNSKEATKCKERVRRVNRTLYLLLAGLAAARRGEVEKLDWTHVNLAGNVIRVPKTKARNNEAKFVTVPIHPVLRPWLEVLRKPEGRIVEKWGSIGRDLPDACTRAGVPRITCNDLRRTFASWGVQAGIPAKVIANLMGHTSTRMVDLVYGRVGANDYELAISKLPGGNSLQEEVKNLHAGYTNTAQTQATRDGTRLGRASNPGFLCNLLSAQGRS